MKGFCICVAIILVLAAFVPTVVPARHIGRQHSHHNNHHSKLVTTRKEIDVEKVKSNSNLYSEIRRPLKKHRKPDTLQIAGSSLPNCSHACGSCTPCRLVMVSFVCSSLAEAETCPMAYKCMCKNKSYPIP